MFRIFGLACMCIQSNVLLACLAGCWGLLPERLYSEVVRYKEGQIAQRIVLDERILNRAQCSSLRFVDSFRLLVLLAVEAEYNSPMLLLYFRESRVIVEWKYKAKHLWLKWNLCSFLSQHWTRLIGYLEPIDQGIYIQLMLSHLLHFPSNCNTVQSYISLEI